jgi:hypothetical protein
MTLGSPFTCLGCFPCYKVKSDENCPAGLDTGGGGVPSLLGMVSAGDNCSGRTVVTWVGLAFLTHVVTSWALLGILV